VVEKTMTPSSFWILGTDTDVGKSYFTALLSLFFQDKGFRLKLSKPLATGLQNIHGENLSPDTESLRATLPPGHQSHLEITPWAYPEAIAPWSAASRKDTVLLATDLSDHVKSLETDVDFVIAEGIGGVAVPLNEKEIFLDAVVQSAWPVLLIVGLQLGCINHALLTLEALKQRRIPLLATVLNDRNRCKEHLRTSSFQEIKSREENLFLFDHFPAFPMALNEITKLLRCFQWSKTLGKPTGKV
jgi:dethiobiotin synthetase